MRSKRGSRSASGPAWHGCGEISARTAKRPAWPHPRAKRSRPVSQRSRSSDCAPGRAWPSPGPGGSSAVSRPSSPNGDKRNSAACATAASTRSAIWPSCSGISNQQDHWEIAGGAFVRTGQIPLFLGAEMNFAGGGGLSYPLSDPKLENGRGGRGVDNYRLQIYLGFETELTHEAVQGWSLVGRIHHRSGGFGLL